MKAHWKTVFLSLLVFGLLSVGTVARVSSDPATCWTILKTADQSSLVLSPGQQYVVNYSVTVGLQADCVPDIVPAEIFDTNKVTVDNPPGWIMSVYPAEVPKTFNYAWVVGPFNDCGSYTVNNTASIFMCGTPNSTWSISVCVPCEGCTLTPGYWKTHSIFGPAPYDNTWALVTPAAENSPFFLSGLTWYEALWVNPSEAGAYIKLAQAYIAAKLNFLNGTSSIPAVDTAIAWAEAFFAAYTPTSALDKSLRQTVLYYAGLMDDYNNGITGPGHCNE